jgi:hypothetical protein
METEEERNALVGVLGLRNIDMAAFQHLVYLI